MSNEKALARFMDKMAALRAEMELLTEAVEDHLGVTPDDCSWGDVTEVTDILAAVKQLNDRLYKRGEFA